MSLQSSLVLDNFKVLAHVKNSQIHHASHNRKQNSQVHTT